MTAQEKMPPVGRNAMTVDVEDYFHVSALAESIDKSQWSSRELRVEQNTERLLQLFSDAGISATFFVLGWVAERCPQLVRRIHAMGHELASHGWSHELVYNQQRDVFRSEADRCKKLLEDLSGSPVLGYRAASYSITAKSMWALDDLIDLGFRYDSSIFPVRHDRYGVPGASRIPGPVDAPSGRSILEFPLTTSRFMGMTIPCSGGGYFRIFPFGLTRFLLNNVVRKDGIPFIFYLHPWEIDADQPRVKASLLSTFRHYRNLDRCYGRLQKLTQLYRFTTVKEVLVERALLR
jgi:polysaccharide deacetylase family protein (PEP-CTERM system associated)